MNTQAIFTIARFTLLEARRARFGWLLALILLSAGLLALFAGQLAITERAAFQSALLAALLRMTVVIAVGLFIITSINREFNDKVVELMFSLPVSRGSYFLGKLLGYSLMALCTVLACAAVLMLFSSPAAALLWSASLFCELLIICAVSLVLVFTLTQVTSSFCALLAFYLLARTISAIQLRSQGPLLDPGSAAQSFITKMIEALAYLLPDLGRFTRTEWLVYPAAQWHELGAILAQTLIYLLLLTAVALFDLYRRNL